MVVKGKNRSRVEVREELYEFDRKTEELVRILFNDKAKDAHEIKIVFLEVRSNRYPIQSMLLHPVCYFPPAVVLICLNQVAIVSYFDDLKGCLLDIDYLCNIPCLTLQQFL